MWHATGYFSAYFVVKTTEERERERERELDIYYKEGKNIDLEENEEKK